VTWRPVTMQLVTMQLVRGQRVRGQPATTQLVRGQRVTRGPRTNPPLALRRAPHFPQEKPARHRGYSLGSKRTHTVQASRKHFSQDFGELYLMYLTGVQLRASRSCRYRLAASLLASARTRLTEGRAQMTRRVSRATRGHVRRARVAVKMLHDATMSSGSRRPVSSFGSAHLIGQLRLAWSVHVVGVSPSPRRVPPMSRTCRMQRCTSGRGRRAPHPRTAGARRTRLLLGHEAPPM
jgi:hypothetical protein